MKQFGTFDFFICVFISNLSACVIILYIEPMWVLLLFILICVTSIRIFFATCTAETTLIFQVYSLMILVHVIQQFLRMETFHNYYTCSLLCFTILLERILFLFQYHRNSCIYIIYVIIVLVLSIIYCYFEYIYKFLNLRYVVSYPIIICAPLSLFFVSKVMYNRISAEIKQHNIKMWAVIYFLALITYLNSYAGELIQLKMLLEKKVIE